MEPEEAKKIAEELEAGKRKKLQPNDKIQFKCQACGRCCWNISILLNPYDIIRLRNSLKLPTQKLLEKKFISFHVGPSSGLPVCTINFTEIEKGVTRCPLLAPAIQVGEMMKHFKKKGIGKKQLSGKSPEEISKMMEGMKIDRWLCAVHKNRPLVCRFFPLGRIIKIDTKTKEKENIFFNQECPPWCGGCKVKEKQTVKDFLDKAEFYHYDEGSAKWQEILELLIREGFLAKTKDGIASKDKAIFKKDSKILFLIANLLYNFDSFFYLSKDKRATDTILKDDAAQEDFMYVLFKIESLIKMMIELFKKYGSEDKLISHLSNTFNKKGGQNAQSKS